MCPVWKRGAVMERDMDRMTDVLLAALGEFERAAPGLSLGQAAMFLHIIRCEGVRMTELSALCGRNDAVVSRGVRAMAVAGEAGTLGNGLGLVELSRGRDGRTRHLAPTPAGLMLAEQLRAILQAGDPGRRGAVAG